MNEKLIAKIRALMAKANDKSGTEAEAALFAAKVQELLVANNLSMEHLREENTDSVGDTELPAARWQSPARRKLLRAVCGYYMCNAIAPYDKDDTWSIIGRPANAIVAVEMTDYLITTVVRLSNQHKRATGGNAIDFRRGAMLRLAVRLIEMTLAAQKQKPTYAANGNPSNLPALFSTEIALIDKFAKDKYNPQSETARRMKLGADAVAGMLAAEDIGLNTQVRTGAGRLAIGKK